MPDPLDETTTQEPVIRPDHHGEVKPPVVDGDAMKRRRKKLLRVAIVLALLVALLIVLTPTLLSTGPGTRLLVSFINGKVPGELAVDDLQLSWFGGQRIQGIDYEDPEIGLEASVATVEADEVDLFSLLRGSRKFGVVEVDGVLFTYTKSPALEEASSSEPSRDEVGDEQPMQIARGLSCELKLTNIAIRYNAPDIEPVQLTMASNEITVTDIRDITFGFKAELNQGGKRGRLSLAGDVLNLFDFDGIEQAELAAYGLNFDVMDVPTEALDQIVSSLSDAVKPGLLMALLGEGELAGNAMVEGTIDQLKSELTIETPKLKVELIQRTEDDVLFASPESYAYLDLDQDGFRALFPDSGLALHKPTRIDLASLEMALPIVDNAVDWDKATAGLLLKAADNLAVVDERGEVLGINELRITGNSDSIADKLSFKLTTVLSAVDSDSNVTSEPVAVDLFITEPLESTRSIDFFSKDLPIQLADALVGKDGQLVLWLGKTLALHADVHGNAVTDAQGNTRIEQQFSLRPEGRITGTVSGSYREGLFRLATPTNEPIEATLAPEAFASLMEMLSGQPGQPALTIDHAMPVYLTLSEGDRGTVSIATRADKKGLKRFYPDPDQTYASAKIELSPARVFDPKLKKTYELRGGSLRFSAPDLRGEIRVKAELDLWVRPNAGEDGVASLLTWQTTVTDLLDSEGSVPLDGKTLMQQVSATGGMTLENAPSGLMDSLLNRDGDLASILGPIVQQMDANFTYKDGQATGASVRLNWDEQNNQPMPGSWASMKPAAFDIDDQQMLTVRGGQDLELEVRVSEAFGDRWMGQLHPILFDAKSGDRPVKIKIDGKSFRFPLKGDKMLGSRVEASVDLGTIEFGSDGLLGKLMGWTNRPGERAVFEPATVSLIDGKVSYDQFDLAVGKVKLRLDGQVDVATGQIVDMAVRVPGASLIQVFNELDGVIQPDDFLSIPMTGEIRKPTFDSQLIGREVARLVTRGLIDQQKDKFRDLIRDGIGGNKPDPAEQDAPPENDPADPADQPAADPVQDAKDELIDRGLDLLFKRLGRDKDKPEQE